MDTHLQVTLKSKIKNVYLRSIFTHVDNVVQFQYILDSSNPDRTLESSTLFYMLCGTRNYNYGVELLL